MQSLHYTILKQQQQTNKPTNKKQNYPSKQKNTTPKQKH